MTVLAHTGHWLVNLAYVIPLVALLVVIVVGRIKDRRAERREPAAAGPEDA